MTAEFQLCHYTKRLSEAPKFLVNASGEIVLNPARRFIRQRLFNLKNNNCVESNKNIDRM